MGNVFSLVQTTCVEIYKRKSWWKSYASWSLKNDIKELWPLIKKLQHESMKPILSWLVSIISWLDQLCNDMWKRHTRPVVPWKNEAILAVNIWKTLCDYLISSIY